MAAAEGLPDLRRRALLAGLPGLLLTACGNSPGRAPGRLVVQSARLLPLGRGSVLELALECELSTPMREALAHGIPLVLAVELASGPRPWARGSRRSIELRHLPLTERYQLRDLERDDARSFPGLSWLLGALGALRLPLPALVPPPAGTPLRADVGLDPSRLPGPLRLPALFEPAWRLRAPRYTWVSDAA